MTGLLSRVLIHAYNRNATDLQNFKENNCSHSIPRKIGVICLQLFKIFIVKIVAVLMDITLGFFQILKSGLFCIFSNTQKNVKSILKLALNNFVF